MGSELASVPSPGAKLQSLLSSHHYLQKNTENEALMVSGLHQTVQYIEISKQAQNHLTWHEVSDEIERSSKRRRVTFCGIKATEAWVGGSLPTICSNISDLCNFHVTPLSILTTMMRDKSTQSKGECCLVRQMRPTCPTYRAALRRKGLCRTNKWDERRTSLYSWMSSDAPWLSIDFKSKEHPVLPGPLLLISLFICLWEQHGNWIICYCKSTCYSPTEAYCRCNCHASDTVI